jgi:hypothetical protein
VSFPVWIVCHWEIGVWWFWLQFVCMIFEHLEKGLVFVAVAINSYWLDIVCMFDSQVHSCQPDVVNRVGGFGSQVVWSVEFGWVSVLTFCFATLPL